MIRYTKVHKTKQGNRVTTKIFTESRIRFAFAWMRGQYEFGRGNSYEFNDIW